MVGLLRSVRDRLNASLLVVEHDIAFIAGLADQLVAMDRGEMLVGGTPCRCSRRRGRGLPGRRPPCVRSGPGTAPATGAATATVTRPGAAGTTTEGEHHERARGRVADGTRGASLATVGRLRIAGPVVLIVAVLGGGRRGGHRPRAQQRVVDIDIDDRTPGAAAAARCPITYPCRQGAGRRATTRGALRL